MAATVAPLHYVPYLRRYARASLGEQAMGDLAVKATLEELLSRGEVGEIDRTDLYRILQAELARRVLETEDGPSGEFHNAAVLDRRLGVVGFERRSLLLLTRLEEFSVLEAAEVVGLAGDRAEALLHDAELELKEQEPTHILIIEDEYLLAHDLADLVRKRGHEVVGIAATRREAVAMAASERPGLILADIKLADNSSGAEAVADILHQTAQIPVVFITAYPERLLTSERPEPTFLLTKPFAPELLDVTIAQALETTRSGTARA